MHKCLLCSSNFVNRNALHHHLRFAEKIKLEDYYLDYLPRFDLYTKELIKFKDVDQYLASVFNTRSNLVKYCKKFPDKAAAAITECIRARSELKGLTRMLSTIEARSVVYPSKLLTDSLNLDWCEIGKSLGLKCRYNYSDKLEYNNTKDLVILQDSREQSPLIIDKSIRVLKNSLSFGDYTASSAHFNNLYVERKSLTDVCGSLSKGYERLCREFERAAEFDARIVVMVEANLNEMFSLPYLPHTKKIKATPDFLLHRMREIMDRFENVQFLFVDGRVVAAKVLVKLLTLKNDVKFLDCQFLYDSKQLI